MSRLLRIAKFAAYPLFYFFCLAFFGYMTFPYDRVRDRILAEVQKKAKPGERLEIEKLTSYWITGVEVRGVKLTSPQDESDAAMSGMAGMAGMAPAASHGSEDSPGGATATPPKEKVVTIEAAHVRVRMLPLLIGHVRIDFWASVFDGEIEGMAPVDGKGGDVEVSFHGIDLGKVAPIAQALGVPVKGTAKGKLALSAPDGKFNKANGSFELNVADITVGDGKTKIAGMLDLPVTKLGTLTMFAEAKEGVLKLVKFNTDGTDLELAGDGRISVKEPWDQSAADLYMRFKFSDVYRGKSDMTKVILGDPASNIPGTIEMLVPKMKRAKRPDGFYGWHVYGPLKQIKFDPSATDPTAVAGAAAPAAGLKARPNLGKPELKRPGGPVRADDSPRPVAMDLPKPPDPPPPPERDRRSPLEIEKALERTGRGGTPAAPQAQPPPAQPPPPAAAQPEPPPPQPEPPPPEAVAPQPEQPPAVPAAE